MQKKIFAAALIICGVVGALIYAAVSTSALPVVTVDQLLRSNNRSSGTALRIGARVAEAPIDYKTSEQAPRFRLAFTVHDIAVPAAQMPVVYYGIMPDTLKAGRDVILEGSFDGSIFAASDIKTQCPSKYEPPVPGGAEVKPSY